MSRGIVGRIASSASTRRLLASALLAGSASILVSVSATQSTSPSRGLAVRAPVGPSGETVDLYTRSAALLVGLSEYDDKSWARLPSVPRELDEVAGVLKGLGFDHVERVMNPTGRQLRDAVADFMKRYDADGARLLFIFSGHGWTTDGQRGYFVTRDSPDPAGDRAAFRDSALSMQQVALWADELFARHAMFIFDSCFSGTIFRTRDRSTPTPISVTTAKPVRQFLSAGDAGETVPANSIFLPIVLNGIRGGADLNHDGYVTGTELGQFVGYMVSTTPGARQSPQFGKTQNPRFNEGDLVFAVPSGDGRVAPPVRTAIGGSSGAAPPPIAASPSRPSGLESNMARRSLMERSVPWTAASLASALTSVDREVLDLFLTGGVEPGMLLEAFGTTASDGRLIAETFFDRGKGNTAALEWLRAMLDRGLDPNATVKGSYYKKEGLLNSAVRAGNAAAVELLLEKGASPHAYQELWFTESAVPRFLFPFNAVVEHGSMSVEEKGRLIKSYLQHGAIIPRIELTGPGDRGATSHTMAIEALAKSKARAGIELTPAAAGITKGTAICSVASKRDKFDWCKLQKELPTHIWVDPMSAKMLHDLYRLELLGMLNVVDGKAYLMGLEQESYGPGLAVVEVSRDGTAWQVFRFMTPQAGMGHCNTDSKGYRPERCWRRIALTYDAAKKSMLVEDYYPYQVGSAFPPRK